MIRSNYIYPTVTFHLFKVFIFLLFKFLLFILLSFLLFSRSDVRLPAGDTNDTFLCGGSSCPPVTDSPLFHDNNLPHSPFPSAADSAQLTISLLHCWEDEEEEEEREEEFSREEKEGKRRGGGGKERRRWGEEREEGGEGQRPSLSLLEQPWKLLRVTTVTVSSVLYYNKTRLV